MGQDFRKLEVWQEAPAFTATIYRVSEQFPEIHRFAVAQQIQRSALSIVSNLAEGAGRKSPKEFLQFINMSQGSASELHARLILAADLALITTEELCEYENILIRTRKRMQTLALAISKNQESRIKNQELNT